MTVVSDNRQWRAAIAARGRRTVHCSVDLRRRIRLGRAGGIVRPNPTEEERICHEDAPPLARHGATEEDVGIDHAYEDLSEEIIRERGHGGGRLLQPPLRPCRSMWPTRWLCSDWAGSAYQVSPYITRFGRPLRGSHRVCPSQSRPVLFPRYTRTHVRACLALLIGVIAS